MKPKDSLVTLYTKKESEQFIQNQRDAKNNLVASMLQNDISRFATNFKTKSIALTAGNHSLIGTVNNKDYKNSPMCSPYNLFCIYPKQRLQFLKNKWLRNFLNIVTSIFQISFKMAKFNRVIQLNNKPCDAIVHPKLSTAHLEQSIEKLISRFPKHAILFPRLDQTSNPELFTSLVKTGFKMVPTRPVHLFHPDHHYMKRSHTKRDFALLRKSEYTLVSHDEITSVDLARIHELYQMLFIDKHTKENPNLTLDYFEKCHANGWYKFFAFRNPEGVIDAFLTYETQDNQMACGPLGYDTSKPKETGLYRLLFAKSLEIASDNHYIFNFGGGNEVFKINRGSLREVGYTAVYCKHLPLYRRIPWIFLSEVGRKITVKIFEKNLF